MVVPIPTPKLVVTIPIELLLELVPFEYDIFSPVTKKWFSISIVFASMSTIDVLDALKILLNIG